MPMHSLTAAAPAKVNLTLRVVGTRPDGFHEIESLVALTDLCDTLSVTSRTGGRLSLTCDAPGIPTDESNLVLKAAAALRNATRTTAGADIVLQKKIPAGAGLGGGSSNAATALRLLNDLWQTGQSPAQLATIGAALGSDVPLFFHGPLCVIRGRGERVERLAQDLSAWLVLVLPPVHCATPRVYAVWDQASTHPARPPLTEVLSAIEAVSSESTPAAADRAMEWLFNDLETPALTIAPELARLRDAIHAATGKHVRVTGSGAGMFRLFVGRPAAEDFAGAAHAATNARVEVCRLFPPGWHALATDG